MKRPTVRGPLSATGAASSASLSSELADAASVSSGDGSASVAGSPASGSAVSVTASSGAASTAVASGSGSTAVDPGSGSAGSTAVISGSVAATSGSGPGSGTSVVRSSGGAASSSVMTTALLSPCGPARGWSAIVLELERDCQIELAQPGDDALQVVAALAGHADGVTLDLRLDLRELVPDQLRDLLGVLLRQPASQADVLADGVATGLFHLAPIEDLEREAAPDRLRLDEVLDRRGAVFVARDQDELVLALGQLDRDALEVVAGLDLATHLVERVPQLLRVEV